MAILNKIISGGGGGGSLGYTPVNKAGDTMTGALFLNAAPTSNLQAATKKYVDDNSAAALGSVPIWSYQDFTNVIGTSLTITQDQNTSASPISITDTSKIVGNSVAVILSNDDSAYPYTSGYSLGFFKVLSKVIDATNILDAITLSGIPDVAFKDNIRVWYMRQCAFSSLPVGRVLPSGNALLKLKAINAAGIASSYDAQGDSIFNAIIFG